MVVRDPDDLLDSIEEIGAETATDGIGGRLLRKTPISNGTEGSADALAARPGPSVPEATGRPRLPGPVAETPNPVSVAQKAGFTTISRTIEAISA